MKKNNKQGMRLEISGEAGVGKTITIGKIREFLIDSGYDVGEVSHNEKLMTDKLEFSAPKDKELWLFGERNRIKDNIQ